MARYMQGPYDMNTYKPNGKYPWRVVTPTGDICSEHATELAALRAANRLQRMGRYPAGYYRVEPNIQN